MSAPTTHRICPDCHALVPVEQLTELPLAGFGTFYECPRCTVGSLTSAWFEATTLSPSETATEQPASLKDHL